MKYTYWAQMGNRISVPKLKFYVIRGYLDIYYSFPSTKISSIALELMSMPYNCMHKRILALARQKYLEPTGESEKSSDSSKKEHSLANFGCYDVSLMLELFFSFSCCCYMWMHHTPTFCFTLFLELYFQTQTTILHNDQIIPSVSIIIIIKWSIFAFN